MRGFALLEMLVTLAILAMVTASVLSASARSLQSTSRLEDKALTMQTTDNHLNKLQLEQTPPSSGRSQNELEFAGHRWERRIQVDSTAGQDIWQVIVWVVARPLGRECGSIEGRAVAHLADFLGNQPRSYSGASLCSSC